MKPDTVVAICAVVISAIAVFVSVCAIVMSARQAEKQIALQTNLTQETERLQERISQDEAKAENGRFFEVLWTKMIELDNINPQEPVAKDVINAINILEFAALCWRKNIVDKDMVVVAFGNMYDLIYTQIQQTNQVIDGLNASGPQLLNQHRTIAIVRDEMRQRLDQQGAI